MYKLFAGDTYYPQGGYDDYKGSFDSHDLARIAAVADKYDWWHVVKDDKIVCEDKSSAEDRAFSWED